MLFTAFYVSLDVLESLFSSIKIFSSNSVIVSFNLAVREIYKSRFYLILDLSSLSFSKSSPVSFISLK